MLSKSLGLSSIKRHDMCKISIWQWIWMNLTRVLPCENSHFSSPPRPLRTFCGSWRLLIIKKTPKVENEHPLLKTTWYVNCVCAFVNGLLLIKIDCEKIGENRGSKDTSYSPFYGTVGRHPGNMWIVSIRLVNQNCIPCCILLLLRSRVPFYASFQRFEGDFEGVFPFYFRWGFEENEEIDHWRSWCSLHT